MYTHEEEEEDDVVRAVDDARLQIQVVASYVYTDEEKAQRYYHQSGTNWTAIAACT